MVVVSSVGCLLDSEPPPRPVSNWTLEEARRFDDFPLYWLGEIYEGLTLTSMRFSTDGDGVRHASFSYGEPSLAGSAPSRSWLPPLKVDIQPYCGFSPEEFLSYEEYYETEVIDVEVLGVDGYLKRNSSRAASLVLWTGGSAIYLSKWRSELDIEDAARDLLPIATSANTTSELLPPPTASC